MGKDQLFRIAFHNNGKVYELYCRDVISSNLWGFIEVSGLAFGEGDGLVVDPTEERMRDEFQDVEVLHLPMHSVVRVEQVQRRGKAIIRDRESGEKVTPFPISPPGRPRG